MRLSEFFPTYPIQIVTPRGSKVRIATRKIYVDLPYEFWDFISEVFPKINESKNPQETFQEELKKFYSDKKDRVTFKNVYLGKLSLGTSKWTTQLLLKLKVNWPVFLEYLEDKAQKLISEIEKEGSNIREVYKEILENFFRISAIVPEPSLGRFNIYELEKFKKLVRQLQEEQTIQNYLSVLNQTIKDIAEITNLISIKLWSLQLKSDFYAVEQCLEDMDILSCYFYLRNALENLVKFVVYLDIAKDINVSQDLLGVFFFYEKVAENRKYNINELSKKYVNVISRYLESVAKTGLDEMRNNYRILDEIYGKMLEKKLPKLAINKDTLKEFDKEYGVKFKNYWSACGEVLHNQSPLPFFSLLEVKAFKHFLRQYSENFISVLEKIIPSLAKVSGKDPELLYKIIIDSRQKLSKVKATKISTLTKQRLSKDAKDVFNELILREETKLIIKSLIEDETLRKETFFDPLTLLSLFHLFSPSPTQIEHGKFDFQDVEYLITKIQPLSLDVKGIIKTEFNATLKILEEKMIPKLEEISPAFSKLKEKEKKAIIFYLLTIKLPEIFKEKS
jgi:N-glycosylase/DNA lyase